MKFQFCGGLSLPEWFISQLNLLSNLSCVKLRKISNLYVAALVDSEQRPAALEQIQEILAAGDFSPAECETVVAMVDFILANAARHNTEPDTLLKELIDLGIPKENCQSLSKILESNLDKLRSTFKQKTLRLNTFVGLSASKWHLVRSSEGDRKHQENQEYFQLKIQTADCKIEGQPADIRFCLDRPQLARFTEEMGAILKLLQKRDQP